MYTTFTNYIDSYQQQIAQYHLKHTQIIHCLKQA